MRTSDFLCTFAPENTKFVIMRKILLFLAAGFFFFSCANNESSSTETSATTSEVSSAPEEETPLIPMAREEDDDRPSIVLEGEGYQLVLPAVAEDVECEPVSDEREAELRSQGYEFIARPIHVTRNGNPHVQLGRAVTVRFAIPEDFPVERYNELVGVLVNENGAEYKIPDYYALREGYVQFQTCHFSDAFPGVNQDSLRERFIDEVAVYGWGKDMSNRQLEPTLREQLNKFAEDHCLGENDLVGIAMREVFGEKDFVKIGLDIVNAHDMENATFEQRAAVASETLIKLAKGKVLSYFIKKLKVDENKKVKVMDELKSEKIGETVYKTEIVKIESRRNKVVGVLEDHFNMENAEKVGTTLGSNPTFEQCYIMAWQYLTEFAKEKTKETLIEMIPYLSYAKQVATATEIWKKFWAATQMQELYKQYEEKADEVHGLLNNDMWNVVSEGIAAPEFLHGMKDEQIKAMIEQRYLEKKEIEARKAELREYLDTIEIYADLKHPRLEEKHFDYVQRLTVVRNLIERFADELVDEDGAIRYVEDGRQQVCFGEKSTLIHLCYLVNKYLDFYPDRQAFYAWLNENGYNYGQLEDEYNRLDKLLWKDEYEKPKKDPDIHIVIQESLGTTGHAKYAGHTICLGTDGVAYKGWSRNIPNSDWVLDEGWSTEFPDEDVDMKLSEYKAIGRPNQVLIYASESDFEYGAPPVKTFAFVVDTTNSYTRIELNPNKDRIIEFVFCDHCENYKVHIEPDLNQHTPMIYPMGVNDALEDALKDIHLHLNSKSDHFSFSASGEYADGNMSSRINLTVNGTVDFEKKEGTCTITATLSGENKQRAFKLSSARFDLTGSISFYPDKYGNYAIGIAGETGPVVWSAVDRGNSGSYETRGYIYFDFQAVDD